MFSRLAHTLPEDCLVTLSNMKVRDYIKYLLPPASWGRHCNLGFTFTLLPLLNSSKESDPASHLPSLSGSLEV